MKNSIYAIVVTYNGAKWVDKCFDSLINSSIPIKVLAIDNNSTDGTHKIIREKFPTVEVIETGSNLGFGKANNIGLRRVLNEKTDYAFLLNQDAWVEPHTIERLVMMSSKNPEYAILSPMHYDGGGELLDKMFKKHLLDQKISISRFHKEENELIELRFVNAAFWLMNMESIQKVGLFDPIFPHYGEDADFLNRVRYHGMKIGVFNSVKGFHDRADRNYKHSFSQKKQMRFISYLVEAKNPYEKLNKRIEYFFIAAKAMLKGLAFFNINDIINSLAIFKLIRIYSNIKTSRDYTLKKYGE